MKIQDLLKREPEKITYDLSVLADSDILPELSDVYELNSSRFETLNDRVDIAFYKYFNFDGRRIWALGCVRIDKCEVMIIQAAGREGTDHSRRFIINYDKYIEMIVYLQRLIMGLENIKAEEKIYNINEDIEYLDNFYGYSLDGEFLRT